MKEEYWTMQDGKEIAVGDMEIDHLRNILRMIVRLNMIDEYYTDEGPSIADDDGCGSDN